MAHTTSAGRLSKRDSVVYRDETYYGVSITLLSLCLVILALRLYARRLTKAGIKADDYCSALALLFCLGNVISSSLALHTGLGGRGNSIAANASAKLFQTIFASELFYVWSISFAKFSVVLYLKRLFPFTKYRPFLFVVYLYLIAWFVVFTGAYMFQCSPVERFWNPTLTGSCSDLKALYLANGYSGLLSDVLLIALPLPMIWSLHISRLQRILLSGIFALSGLTCAITILRLSLIAPLDLNPGRPTSDWNGFNLWSTIEICLCHMVTCCPTLGPYFNRRILRLRRHPPSSSTATKHTLRSYETGTTRSHSKGSATAMVADVEWSGGIRVDVDLDQEVQGPGDLEVQGAGQGQGSGEVHSSGESGKESPTASGGASVEGGEDWREAGALPALRRPAEAHRRS